MYIANTTSQHRNFDYRIPAEDVSTFGRTTTKRIEAGKQEQVHGEAPLVVLEAIVAQYRIYGIMSEDEAVRAKGMVELVYSFDKPVNLDRLNYAFDHNKGVLFDRGTEMRRETAIAIDHTFEQELRQPMRAVEIETLHEAETPQMAEGLRVVHDHDLAREGGQRAGRGR